MNKEEIEQAKKCLNEIITNTYAEDKAMKLDNLRKYIQHLEQKNKQQKEELEMYKDFKEIANTKIGDANPLKVLEVNKMLDKQCKRFKSILDKVTEECNKQIAENEDSILELFPQKILNIIEGEENENTKDIKKE